MLGEAEFCRDLIAWLIAVAVTALVAVPGGLLLGSIPVVRTAVGAVIEFLRPIPAIMWWPLFYIIIKDGPQTKITLAVYAAIWPILFNIVYALGEVDRTYIDTARSFGLGRLSILVRVKLPDVLPFALTGLRIAATFALLVVVSTELVFGGERGVGSYLIRYGEESGPCRAITSKRLLVRLRGRSSASGATHASSSCDTAIRSARRNGGSTPVRAAARRKAAPTCSRLRRMHRSPVMRGSGNLESIVAGDDVLRLSRAEPQKSCRCRRCSGADQRVRCHCNVTLHSLSEAHDRRHDHLPPLASRAIPRAVAAGRARSSAAGPVRRRAASAQGSGVTNR